jgi:hypothetical protein
LKQHDSCPIKISLTLIALPGKIFVFLLYKTDRHDMTEILLKVALKTISLNQAIKYCGVKQHVPFTSTGSTEKKYIRVRETRRCNQEYILTNPYRR